LIRAIFETWFTPVRCGDNGCKKMTRNKKEFRRTGMLDDRRVCGSQVSLVNREVFPAIGREAALRCTMDKKIGPVNTGWIR
jgi:hypothetical protein